jgi:hypothetical protein
MSPHITIPWSVWDSIWSLYHLYHMSDCQIRSVKIRHFALKLGGFLFTKFFQIFILKYVVWKFLKMIHRWYFLSWEWWHPSPADLFLLLQVIMEIRPSEIDWVTGCPLLPDLRSFLQNSVGSAGIVSWMRAALLYILFDLHNERHSVT